MTAYRIVRLLLLALLLQAFGVGSGVMYGLGASRDCEQEMDGSRESAPCGLPWAPATCLSSGPCMPAALPAFLVPLKALKAAESPEPAVNCGIPASRLFSPDPPPPRS